MCTQKLIVICLFCKVHVRFMRRTGRCVPAYFGWTR